MGLFGAGSASEPSQKAGISHLLEHMMFRGCEAFPTFSSLSEAFESLGGEWNAATGHEYTEFYYSGVVTHQEEATKLLADFLLAPKFNDLETEKRIVLRELDGELNEQGLNTDIDFHVLRLLWPESSMAQPIIGNAASLESITKDDLKSWYSSQYRPDEMVLAIVGGREDVARSLSQELFASFSKSSKSLRTSKSPISNAGPVFELIENSDSEYAVQIAYACEGTGSLLTPHYDLLSRVLSDGFSSRLVRRLREELGLVYDISTTLQQYDFGGTFSIATNVDEEHIETLLSEINLVIRSVCERGISEQELIRHKRRATTDLELVINDPTHAGFRVAWAVIKNQDTKLESWHNKIDDLKAADIQKAARDLFNKKHRIAVAMGPANQKVEAVFRRGLELFL